MARTTSSVTARAAKKRVGPSHTRSKFPSHRSNGTTSVTAKKPFISLQAFISNFFFLVAIQDNDAFFEETYDTTEARRITETGNGDNFDREGFKDFIAQLRKNVSDRQLVSQSFVVVPDDATGITGDVAHNVELSGIQSGKNVTIKIVAVLRIIFDEKAGKRLIDMESFVLQTRETDED